MISNASSVGTVEGSATETSDGRDIRCTREDGSDPAGVVEGGITNSRDASCKRKGDASPAGVIEGIATKANFGGGARKASAGDCTGRQVEASIDRRSITEAASESRTEGG